MNLASIFAAIKNSMEIAKSFIAAGKDVAPIITTVYEILAKGKKVTQADVDKLQAQNDAWSAELQAPLPPEEP